MSLQRPAAQRKRQAASRRESRTVATNSIATRVADSLVQAGVTAGVQSGIYGTSFSNALQSSLIGQLSAEASNQIGDAFVGEYGGAGHVLAHAALGCATAALKEQDCGSGALGAAVSAAASPYLDQLTFGNELARQTELLALSTLSAGAIAQLVGADASTAIEGARNGVVSNSLTHPSPTDTSMVAGIRNAILRGDVEELRLLLGNVGSELTANELAIAQKTLSMMESLSVADRAMLASRYGVNYQNAINHAFGQAKHNLGPLVQEFGSPAQAFVQVQSAVDAAYASTGSIPSAVQVGQFTVRVGGAIADGFASIRTLFIPK